jgi:hypothetical protein
MADETVIREDRRGMVTVTYPTGAQQHFNSLAEAEAAAKEAGATNIVVEPYQRGGDDEAEADGDSKEGDGDTST